MGKKTSNKYLISIVGPTAVGKTSLSIALAKKYNTEILSCDSRQMYKQMDIGTAKPNKKIMAAIPHHFIDTLDPTERYSAAQFERDAEVLLVELFQKHDIIIAAGGSTLYFDALWYGLDDMPEVPTKVKEQLQQEWEENGLEPLVKELEEVDSKTFAEVDLKNQMRVIRALAIWRASGKPISHFRKGKRTKDTFYKHIKIGLRLERNNLYNRINVRVERMAKKGLAQEVQTLLDAGYSPELNALQSIGYREMIPYLKGETNFYSAIKMIQRNSRRYAKRQLNWYRRYPEIKWFEAGNEETALVWVEQELGRH